jgi:hypothetical protein
MRKEKFLQEVARQKGTKTNLKAHKVSLAILDEINDTLDLAQHLVTNAFVEAMDEGDAAYMRGRDIMRFDFNDAMITAESKIDEVKSALDELGVAYPEDLQYSINRFSDTRQEEDASRDRFQKWDAIY